MILIDPNYSIIKNAGLIDGLGLEAFYLEVFDPTYSKQTGEPKPGWIITDKDASQGWLVDDFGDIYRDLKIELTKIEKIGTDEAVEEHTPNTITESNIFYNN